MNWIKQNNKNINKLKEVIKHRQKGVGLDYRKQIDDNRRKHMQTQDEELIELVSRLKLYIHIYLYSGILGIMIHTHTIVNAILLMMSIYCVKNVLNGLIMLKQLLKNIKMSLNQ